MGMEIFKIIKGDFYYRLPRLENLVMKRNLNIFRLNLMLIVSCRFLLF